MTCKRHGGSDGSIMCKYCDAETIERYAMNKTEIQARIEKCESDLASLKADLSKCDCTEGVEQEKCWHALDSQGDVRSASARTQRDCKNYFSPIYRQAYMPECRQVTAEDVRGVWKGFDGTMSHDEFAKRAHKLGFRIKVTP